MSEGLFGAAGVGGGGARGRARRRTRPPAAPPADPAPGLLAGPRAPEVFVRVAVERGIEARALRASGSLTYRANDSAIAVGQRVRVPLGRGNKPADGVVIAVGGRELLAGFPLGRVKRILGTSAGAAALAPRILDLAAWISEYYVSPLGTVLKAMTPGAVRKSIGAVTWHELERAPLAEAQALIAAKGAGKFRPTLARAWEAVSNLPAGAFPLRARALADAIGARTLAPINRLLDLGLLRRIERTGIRAVWPDWFDPPANSSNSPPRLTPDQSRVVSGISGELSGFTVHLIRGVTGSGKTEVYLRIIESVIAAGRTAIVLVPEIALTPQTAARFTARFGSRGVALLHSGLTAAQRNHQWSAAASGAARVVVGARSAVFAPVPDLGLIVVDEEHDSSYKQDQSPRYHARDVAVKRGQIEGCPVVLGSATPSLESWLNAGGRYTLWELPDRVGGRLPVVRIVDLRDERRRRATMPRDASAASLPGQLNLLGPTLEAAIAETLRARAQVMLLLNRRGFANYLCCVNSACGWAMFCDDCDAPMVLHRRRTDGPTPGEAAPHRGVVRCHHCLSAQVVPRACPSCGGRIIPLGMGTQRLEGELVAKFGGLGIAEGRTLLRVDSDTMTSAKDYFQALGRFGRGEARMLVGTQMIAKGLDFPGVRLVGVVNADTALNTPDFRASERTFQLVCQVAGRAGRGTAPGLVIVQTMAPESEAIRHAATHDYPSFAAGELRVRRESGLPPATRLARVIVRDKDRAKGWSRAGELARLMREAAGAFGGEPGVRVEGPMECPLRRVAGYHRFEVQAAGPSAKAVHAVLVALRDAGALVSDDRTAVDVDPVTLL